MHVAHRIQKYAEIFPRNPTQLSWGNTDGSHRLRLIGSPNRQNTHIRKPDQEIPGGNPAEMEAGGLPEMGKNPGLGEPRGGRGRGDSGHD